MLQTEQPLTQTQWLEGQIAQRKDLLELYHQHKTFILDKIQKYETKLANLFPEEAPLQVDLNYEISKLKIEYISASEAYKFKEAEYKVWQQRLVQFQDFDKRTFEATASEAGLNYEKYLQIAKDNSEGESAPAVILREILAEIEEKKDVIDFDQAEKNTAFMNLKHNLLNLGLIK